jgi:uncharacterized protein (TIGR02271 family)
MKTSQHSTVIGVFENRRDAERAIDELRKAGFRENQIGIVARDSEGKMTTEKAAEKGTRAGTGAVAGAVAGAGVGGLVGLGILTGVIPVVGPIIAGGALATILANAAGGAVIAGVAGALIGLGIPEEDARYYESEFKAGRTIVTVQADGRYDEALAIIRKFGGYDRTSGTIAGTSQAACATGTAQAASKQTAASQLAGEKTIPVREEQLHVHKQPAEAGEVRLHKEVVTENKTVDVPVQREEVVIERRPASGQASPSDIRAGEDIRVPLKEEKVQVDKNAVVKEEVHVGKRQVQDTKQVGGTVRKEEVRVERKGDPNVVEEDAGKRKNVRK